MGPRFDNFNICEISAGRWGAYVLFSAAVPHRIYGCYQKVSAREGDKMAQNARALLVPAK